MECRPQFADITPLPLFSFGLISDIQYVPDRDNGMNFQKTKTRYYRNAITQLDNAIKRWNGHTNDISFLVQLGDTIDGWNVFQRTSQASFDAIMDAFSRFHGDVHHVIGNHELYNFTRDYLRESPFNSGRVLSYRDTNDARFYYDFSPSPRFRIVILDTYELSLLGVDKTGPLYEEACDLLRTKNTNADWNDAAGMEGYDVRFLKYNGSLTATQLAWLDDVLQDADAKKQHVIVAGHIPLLPDAFDNCNLCWNYASILDVLHAHSCVVAYLSGHVHESAHAIDDHGVHHVTLAGVVETPENDSAYGTVHAYEDAIKIIGSGRVPDLSISLTNRYVINKSNSTDQ